MKACGEGHYAGSSHFALQSFCFGEVTMGMMCACEWPQAVCMRFMYACVLECSVNLSVQGIAIPACAK